LLRPRHLALVATLATLVTATPVLTATAMAADPTVVVRPGDSLTSISRRTGVPVARLVELNRLSNPNRIYAGQRLRTAKATSARAAARVIHVVNRGSTVWHIAKRYGVSVSSIVAANGLANPGHIVRGQRLVIPGASAPRPAPRPSSGNASRPAARVTHVVNRGSTLWHIARRYGVSVTAIVSANGLANPSRIFAGQRLLIPGARAATDAAPAPRATVPASMTERMARRDTVRRIILREADRYRVPRAFALAVAWQESGWQQGVTSSAGAVGVMQLMPGTAAWIGETMLGRRVNTHDTRSNVRAGVRLLRHYLDRYGGNRDLVLAAYYQGQGAVDRHGIYPVSRPYIASIRSIERLLGG
jgi:N-acetylmuramoyl-L-alanine amidase